MLPPTVLPKVIQPRPAMPDLAGPTIDILVSSTARTETHDVTSWATLNGHGLRHLHKDHAALGLNTCRHISFSTLELGVVQSHGH